MSHGLQHRMTRFSTLGTVCMLCCTATLHVSVCTQNGKAHLHVTLSLPANCIVPCRLQDVHMVLNATVQV